MCTCNLDFHDHEHTTYVLIMVPAQGDLEPNSSLGASELAQLCPLQGCELKRWDWAPLSLMAAPCRGHKEPACVQGQAKIQPVPACPRIPFLHGSVGRERVFLELRIDYLSQSRTIKTTGITTQKCCWEKMVSSLGEPGIWIYCITQLYWYRSNANNFSSFAEKWIESSTWCKNFKDGARFT